MKHSRIVNMSEFYSTLTMRRILVYVYYNHNNTMRHTTLRPTLHSTCACVVKNDYAPVPYPENASRS